MKNAKSNEIVGGGTISVIYYFLQRQINLIRLPALWLFIKGPVHLPSLETLFLHLLKSDILFD